ncbi:MAG: ECF transporter S component [Desulfurococcales archaeon]|nr:ECF transporter S component [Desulfurococcales archaeon]
MVSGRGREAKILVYTAIMTALVFTATMVAMEIPATGGYFNLGETMVYTAAIIGGPLTGAVAGGLGSALADIYTGYGIYAPGTLVIKGLEGFIVGAIFRRLAGKSEGWVRSYTIPLTLILALILYIIGVEYFTGTASFYVFSSEISFNVTSWFWLTVSILLVIPAVYFYYRNDTEGFAITYSIIPGGLEMIAGYYLYEISVVGLEPQQAAVEVPFNFGQMIIGLFVALYLARALREAGVKV